MPSYLIVLLASGGMSIFARQLAEVVGRYRARGKSADELAPQSASIELYVRQPDGLHQLAGGELPADAVQKLIDEIEP